MWLGRRAQEYRQAYPERTQGSKVQDVVHFEAWLLDRKLADSDKGVALA